MRELRNQSAGEIGAPCMHRKIKVCSFTFELGVDFIWNTKDIIDNQN